MYTEYLNQFCSACQNMSVSVSVLTLMAISIERYQAIVHPLKFSGTKQRARILILSVWILSILLVLPGWILIKKKDSILNKRCFFFSLRCNYDDTHSTIQSSTSDYLSYIVNQILMFFVLNKTIFWFHLVVSGMHLHYSILSINYIYHCVYLLFRSVLWCLLIVVLRKFYGVHYRWNGFLTMRKGQLIQVNTPFQVGLFF